MVRHMPVRWLPLIPLLTLRALRSERRRVAHLAEKVPLELIYP
jgi:hypothetical protein